MNRKDFKLLVNSIYLDHSASSLKPQEVIDAGVDFYENYPINPHSLDSKLGVKLLARLNEIRQKVSKFNNVKPTEVIFTSGTTDGLNKIARMFDDKLGFEDEILISYLNHGSNVVVWMELAKRTGAKLKWSKNILEDITKKTKVVAIAQENNTIQQEINLPLIYKKIKKFNGYLINDAAQAIAHESVDGQLADFTVWSANKLYGPTGSGVMLMKESTQKEFPIVYFGGGSTADYSEKEWIAKKGFNGREAGTPNTAGIIMMGAALDYINKIGLEKIHQHEKEIALYAFDKISQLKNVVIISKRGENNLVFNVKGYNSQDVVSYLGHNGVILRAGQHCVKNIKKITGDDSWIRASFGLYNDKSDFDKLYELLETGGDFIDFI